MWGRVFNDAIIRITMVINVISNCETKKLTKVKSKKEKVKATVFSPHPETQTEEAPEKRRKRRNKDFPIISSSFVLITK